MPIEFFVFPFLSLGQISIDIEASMNFNQVHETSFDTNPRIVFSVSFSDAVKTKLFDVIFHALIIITVTIHDNSMIFNFTSNRLHKSSSHFKKLI